MTGTQASDSGDIQQDKQRELQAEYDFYHQPEHIHQYSIPVEFEAKNGEYRSTMFIPFLQKLKVVKLRCSLPGCSEEVERG